MRHRRRVATASIRVPRTKAERPAADPVSWSVLRRRPANPPSLILRAGLILALVVGATGAWFASRGPAPIDPSWDRVTVKVPELDCGFWCGVRLSDALDGIAGMRAESFDPRRREVVVRFDAAGHASDDVVEALTARGIQARAAAR